mgnify:CR=1 FL=1
MADCKEKLFDQFPPVSTEEWMEKVTADLKGADFNKKLVWRTNEGFNVKPMYRAEDTENLKTTDSRPGEYPYIRGTKSDNNWLIRQEIIVDDVTVANKKANDILTKGVNSLGFHVEEAHITPENMAALLKDIDVENIEINFHTCIKNAAKLIETTGAYYKSIHVDTTKAKGSFNYDPFKRMLKRGRDFANYATQAASLIKSASELLPKFSCLGRCCHVQQCRLIYLSRTGVCAGLGQ